MQIDTFGSTVMVGSTPTVIVLFSATLLFAAISGMSLSVRLRVSLVYSYCLIVVLMNQAISLQVVAIGSAAALFLVLEVFNTDEDLVRLFSLKYKLIDFLYRMICEYYGIVFFSLLFFLSMVQQHVSTTAGGIFALLSISILTAITSRGKFASKGVTEIRTSLDELGGSLVSCRFNEKDRKKLEMLLFLEDRTFFVRGEKNHTLSLASAATKKFSRIRDGFRRAKSITREAVYRSIRGYGTIEMQLLRNIGLVAGSYRCFLRRKTFEIVFSNTIFNSYLEQLSKESDARKNMKQWILRCYLHAVPVKIGEVPCRPTKDESTFHSLFNKEFEELSCEEFFVWCLGLKGYRNGVGPIAVSKNKGAIDRFQLDEQKVNAIIDVLRG